MYLRLILLTALLLTPLPALGIGYVYTGVGDDGRQHLELTRVTVDVRIDERVARTRTDQIFTNHAEWEVEGIYEFTLPEGAIITDLVLWIGDKRIQGLIMEKEEARRVYDDIVRQRIDPALIEQVTPNQFRLSIFPFPAKGSRRVEFEYMQLLDARNGRIDYTFPLAPEDRPGAADEAVRAAGPGAQPARLRGHHHGSAADHRGGPARREHGARVLRRRGADAP